MERYSRDTVVVTTAEIEQLAANKALDPTAEYWVDRNRFAYAPDRETIKYLVEGGGSAGILVAGTPGVGNVLTASFPMGVGTVKWQDSPDGVTWTDIALATNLTFTQTFAQSGKKVRPLATSYAPFGGVVSVPVQVDALAVYFAAIAARDTAPVKIVGIGDSWMEYRMAQAFGSQWTQLIQAQLRGKYNTTGLGAGGGIGYVPIHNVSIFAPYTNPWAKTGAPGTAFTSGGLGLRYATFGAGQSALISVTGTSCILHYLKANATRVGYYKVDGGAAVTFETNNGTITDDGFLPITLGASGVHTLEVGWSSGGQVYIGGAMFFNGDENKGIHFYEGGHTAYRTTDYIGAAPGAAATRTRIAAINPQLVILALGQNDFALTGTFISAAQYKTNLKQLISEYRAAGVTSSWQLVLSADVTAIKDATQTSTWAQFQTAAKEVAAEDTGGNGGATGVAVVSITDSGRIPASPGAAGGLWADGAHVGNAGHVIVSDVIFGAINR